MENKLTPKKKIWEALRWEVSPQELSKLFNLTPYEKDDYFDLELMLDKIHRFMNGEKPTGYFMNWCLVLMNCLMHYSSPRKNSKLNGEYYAAGDNFDAFAFHNGTPEECRWLIAKLKWHDHRIRNLKNKSNNQFETNGVSVYVEHFSYFEGSDTDLDLVLIADNSEKKFNLFFYNYIDYSEHINYSFISNEEDVTDIVYKNFYDYKFDPELNFTYYKLNH